MWYLLIPWETLRKSVALHASLSGCGQAAAVSKVLLRVRSRCERSGRQLVESREADSSSYWTRFDCIDIRVSPAIDVKTVISIICMNCPMDQSWIIAKDLASAKRRCVTCSVRLHSSHVASASSEVESVISEICKQHIFEEVSEQMHVCCHHGVLQP